MGRLDQPQRHIGFGVVHGRQKRERAPVDIPQLERERHAHILQHRLHRFGRQPQQSRRRGDQFVHRQAGVTVAQIVPQHIQQPRFHPAGIVRRALHLCGDLVGAFKPDVQSVAAQLIGVLLDPFDGLGAPFFETANRFVGGDAIFAQRQHHLAQPKLGGEFLTDLAGAFFGDALDLRQPFRLLFQHPQRILAEAFQNVHRGGLANPLDRAGR